MVRLFVVVLILLAMAPAWAEKPLRIIACGNPPFTEVDTHGKTDGLAIRLWHGIAEQLKLEYSIAYTESIEDGVDQVVRGDADVAVGPIGATSARARITEYTLPYYTAKLSIVSRHQDGGWLERFETIGKAAAILFIILLGVLFVVGNVIWLVERRRNEQHFSNSYLAGVGNGMWLALVTMTTVGYGDTVPVTSTGRVLIGLWMFLAMLFGSTLTASLATYLTHYRMTHNGFRTTQDLTGHRVAVKARSRALEVVMQSNAIPVIVADLDAAIAHLEQGRVDALLFHEPEILYWQQHHCKTRLQITPIADIFVNYGFLLRRNSPLTPRLDEAMLLLQENGIMRRIEAHWLGELGGKPQ